MAESTGSRLTSDDDFWEMNQNDCQNSDRVSFKNREDSGDYCRYDRDRQHNKCLLYDKKISEWHGEASIEGFIGKARVGEWLEVRRLARAKSTGSRLTYDGDFWKVNENDCHNSDNNFGRASVWCDLGNIPSLIEKLRFGDRLEFKTNQPRTHCWGIYVGNWESFRWGVVHLISGNEEEMAYSSMKNDLHVSLPTSKNVRVYSIFNCVGLPGCKVRINNLKDKEWPPVGTGLIRKEISYQLEELPERSEIKSRVSFQDSEDFVNYCRYDKEHQHNMCFLNGGKVTGWYSENNIDGLIGQICVGDRLEFKHASAKKRWGIYVNRWGDRTEQVVHFAMSSSGMWRSARDKPELCVESIRTAIKYQIKINNARDRDRPPVDREHILKEISRQLPGKTRRHACKIAFKDSEVFVNYCRYDDLHINFGLVSKWCKFRKLLPRLCVGDRLEFKCIKQSDSQFGIYVGEWEGQGDQVVHFSIAQGGGSAFALKMNSPLEYVAKYKPTIRVSSIEEALENREVRINNKLDTTWPPFVGTEIIREIMRQLDSQSAGYRPVFHLFSNNCEHFVNHCRYGRHRRDQAGCLRWFGACMN